MQIDAQELLTEAGELALTVRMLEKRLAALLAENAQLRAQLSEFESPADAAEPETGGSAGEPATTGAASGHVHARK